MTVEAVERLDRPRRTVSARVLVAAFAILVAGIGVAAAAFAFSGGDGSASIYEAELAPLIATHNEIVGKWNGFLDDYNRISLNDPFAFDARAEEARALVDQLSTQSQGVILAWDRITPPPDMETAHVLAGDAMRETQNGFIELGDYFGNIVKYGIAFDEDLKAGTSRLELAARYWEQAREAAETATN